MQPDKRTVAAFLAKFYLRHGRGHSLVDFVITMVKNIVYLGALSYLFHDWFGLDVPKVLLIVFGLAFEVTCYTIGYVDERLGFWKYQNIYNSTTLNPYGEELLAEVKDIKKRLDNNGIN